MQKNFTKESEESLLLTGRMNHQEFIALLKYLKPFLDTQELPSNFLLRPNSLHPQDMDIAIGVRHQEMDGRFFQCVQIHIA